MALDQKKSRKRLINTTTVKLTTTMYQKLSQKKLKHKSYILGGDIFFKKSREKWTEHMNKYFTQDTMVDNKPDFKISKQ